MLNIWKYGHLCEKLTFIGYLCEICSMCKNMAIYVKIWLSFDICVKIWLFLKCVKFLKFYVQFLMDTILNPAITQISDEEKGRRALGTCISHLRKGRHANEMHISHPTKGRPALRRYVSPLLNVQKRIPTDYSPRDSPCANTHHDCWHTYVHVCVPTAMCRPVTRSTVWSMSCLTSLKHLDYCGFKC
jgi:hypothetical protein